MQNEHISILTYKAKYTIFVPILNFLNNLKMFVKSVMALQKSMRKSNCKAKPKKANQTDNVLPRNRKYKAREMLLEWGVGSRVTEITGFNFSDIIDYTWVLPKCDKQKIPC